MNREEMLEKYGTVPLKFTGYYKYSFSFSGVAPDGAKIYVSIGGNASDIYRLEVDPDDAITIKADDPCSISIKKDDVKIYSEYSY